MMLYDIFVFLKQHNDRWHIGIIIQFDFGVEALHLLQIYCYMDPGWFPGTFTIKNDTFVDTHVPYRLMITSLPVASSWSCPCDPK